MPRKLSKAALLILLALPTAGEAKKEKIAPDAFSVTLPDPAPCGTGRQMARSFRAAMSR